MSPEYPYGLGRPCEVCHREDNGEFMVLAGACPAGHLHELCTDCFKKFRVEVVSETYTRLDGRTSYRKRWLSCADAARVAAELMAEDQS